MGRRRNSTDEGFTLSELVVVIALLFIVVSGAWALIRLVNIGATQSNRESWISREIAGPLESADRIFSQQAPPIQVVGPYVCKVRTDQDRDDLYEYHQIEATADGRLIDYYYEESTTTSPTADVRVWSRSNVNVASSIPMFRYFDVTGADISGEGSVAIIQDASSIIITVVTEHEEKQYSGSRQVYFRNR